MANTTGAVPVTSPFQSTTTGPASDRLTGFDAFCGEVFFNSTALLQSSWPRFSQCFLDTVVVWLPCLLFWLMTAGYVIYQQRSAQPSSRLPFTAHNASKLFCCSSLSILALVMLLDRLGEPQAGSAGYVGDVILFVTMLLAGVMTQYERVRGVASPEVAFIFWFLKCVMDVIPFYTIFMTKLYDTDMFRFVVQLALYMLVLAMLLLYSCAERTPRHRRGYVPLQSDKTCPEVGASFLSQLTFAWLTKLMIMGFKKDLTADDLWDLNPREKSENLVPIFERLWKAEVERCMCSGVVSGDQPVRYTAARPARGASSGSGMEAHERSLLKEPRQHGAPSYTDLFHVTPQVDVQRLSQRPSLYRVLWRQFGSGMLIITLQKLLSDCSMMLAPVLLGELIDMTWSGRGAEGGWLGYVLALGMMLSGLVRTVFFALAMYRAWLMGMHIKSVLVSAIYNKSLRLSNESRKTSTQGEVVNHMSVDAQRVQEFMMRVFFGLTTPFQIIVALLLIYVYVGAAVFTGFLLLLLLIPFNAYVAHLQRRFQEQNLLFKDIRVRLVNETLNGIKVLKLYAWEPSFAKRVEQIRVKEIAYLFKIAVLYLCTGMCWNIAPFLVTLATYATFVLTQPESFLDPSKAFVTLALFNILRTPMDFLSTLISFTVQANVSLKRINKFLCVEEMDTQAVTRVSTAAFAISVDQASFCWGKTLSPTLRNVQLDVPEGRLVAVVGQVGAGKSSLINAVLGEMDKVRGRVTVKGSVAYVAQQAWIQNATLRDNILFGRGYHDDKYRSVLKACQLERDLEILSAGDMTEIGEKGINLSGGQKQRVSLARAVYSDSHIFLLDDPLSAVDSHVGKAIFTQVIGPKGLLHSKTRVLVTHGVHWLPLVDEIIVLSDGKISEKGSYSQLMRHDGPFAQFLKTYFTQGAQSEEEEEEEEDPDVEAMKQEIFNQMESVTSDGGVTSADELRDRYLRQKRNRNQGANCDRSLSRESAKRRPKVTKEEVIERGQLTSVEKLETGKVSWGVYWTYFRAAGLLPFAVGLVSFAAFRGISVWANFWLSQWTEDPLLNNQSQWGSQIFIDTNRNYLLNYGLLGLAQLVLLVVYNYFYWTRMVYAGKTLHDALLTRLFRAPMAFFDTTPIGRIMNRVSREIEVVDSLLPLLLRDFMSTSVLLLCTLLVILIQTPLFAAVLLPLALFYYVVQRFYIPTARQVKRIENITRSPIFTHFSETLSGAATIRAYGVTDRFIEESKRRVDRNTVFYFANAASLRWLQMNLDAVANLIVFFAAVFELLSSDATGGGLGLSVSYALQVSSTLTYMVRQVADLETNIVSVERLKEYSLIDTEAAWVNVQRRPQPNWPVKGEIIMENYQTRYRPGLDLVLTGFTCKFKAGEKVGVVGRTGAGKSSLTLALFRILEAAGGAILIDGINIADIGLHDLRSRLTILPQDAVIFSGSLRFNLDPVDQYTEQQIWQALERAHLKPFVSQLPDGLLFECGEEGQNLSVGQRQLLCLARTLLRQTRILVLDEATAAVDMETDTLIQNTIRLAFHNCTIITIAHRLNTILDYDKVMVMDAGKVKELDSPDTLLADSQSVFYAMAKDAGLV